MDGGLRLGHLLAVTLLLGSMAWTLVTGQLPGPTLNSFRPLFIGRCEEYQHFLYPQLFESTSQLKDCGRLWMNFYDSFARKGQCSTGTESYKRYIEAAKHDINKLSKKLLYWTGPLKSLADELCAEGRRYVTLKNYLPGYIVTNVKTWCGKTNSRDDDVNFDECWNSSSCAEGMTATDAFWKALSAHVASFVEGDVYLLLNGSSGQAYNNRSTFAQYELPYLNKSRNPLIRALLVHVIETDAKGETCNSGSLLDLKRDVEAKDIKFECEDDPKEVQHLLCVDNPSCPCCMFRGSKEDKKMFIIAVVGWAVAAIFLIVICIIAISKCCIDR